VFSQHICCKQNQKKDFEQQLAFDASTNKDIIVEINDLHVMCLMLVGRWVMFTIIEENRY